MNLAVDTEAMLGVPKKEIGTIMGVARTIERGLHVSAVDRVARAIAPSNAAFRYRLVNRATLDRRRRDNQRLTVDEGNRLARIARVYDLAMSIYRDHDKARAFLARPHMLLDGEAPVDVAIATGPGADAVSNILGRMAYGGGV